MVGIKEGLTIVAKVGEAVVEERKDDIGWQFGSGLARTFRLQGIAHNLIVFDIVTLNFNRRFPVFIANGVVERGERFNNLVANPLTHFRETAQPAVVVLFPGRRYHHRNLLPV
ncbi:Uncharacterised protein [Enterobacter roggenkampii]|uniref:Uncharacterized protein n=1 Tax=Enterobacter roggenkampii TaxID=1812935 RepID=A0ABD7KRK4_9ENTR|nr:Uncharacterised protein [Enterobacter roggenkampii]